jgi:ribosomal protein S18 acetylase RimI-like enzyme
VTPLHPDANLVSDVHAAQFEFLRGRMNAMRDVRGDPSATLFFEAEHLRACMAPGVLNPFFNQVFLSGPAAIPDVESVLAAFGQHAMKPQIDVAPGAVSPELALCLARHGFRHTQSYPVLVYERGTAERPQSDVAVVQVESGRDIEAFKDTYVRGWQVEAWLTPILQSYIERWLGIPGWTLYLASEQGEPIGVGILFEHRLAYLADAATAPELRRRGAQRALIARRIADAQQRAATVLFSRAESGSSSHRNLERAGFKTRYTAAVWTKEMNQG